MKFFSLKKSIRLFLPLITGLLLAPHAEAQQWQCELNLHQGDTGTLEFTRNGERITGQTVVSRTAGGTTVTNRISGSWRGEIIEFERTLNPSSSHQMFKGVALATRNAVNRPGDIRDDDPSIRIAGRFAFKYGGIWSADCRIKPLSIQPGILRRVPELKPVAPQAVLPKTHRTGKLKIPQTYQADLDQGTVTSGSSVDIWFQAKTATDRYITPRNKALIGIAGTRSINREGCAAMKLSKRSISLHDAPEGTYICVKTNEGRYSQFRINAPVGRSPGALEIGFTTWK